MEPFDSPHAWMGFGLYVALSILTFIVVLGGGYLYYYKWAHPHHTRKKEHRL